MSLKKQVKELKTELVKKDEELLMSKRNIKQTRFFELDQEIKIYKEELSRMRYMLEHNFMTMN
jgi:ribosomal protein L4